MSLQRWLHLRVYKQDTKGSNGGLTHRSHLEGVWLLHDHNPNILQLPWRYVWMSFLQHLKPDGRVQVAVGRGLA